MTSRSNLVHTVLRLADNSTVPIIIAPCRNSSLWRVVEPPLQIIKRHQFKIRRNQCNGCGANRQSKPRPGCASTTHAARYQRMIEARRKSQ